MIVNGTELPIAGFETWKEQKTRSLLEENPVISCAGCAGEGETECRCCGNWADCKACGGAGEFEYLEADRASKDRAVSWGQYVLDVKRDVRQLCSWTGIDFEAIDEELTEALCEQAKMPAGSLA